MKMANLLPCLKKNYALKRLPFCALGCDESVFALVWEGHIYEVINHFACSRAHIVCCFWGKTCMYFNFPHSVSQCYIPSEGIQLSIQYIWRTNISIFCYVLLV